MDAFELEYDFVQVTAFRVLCSFGYYLSIHQNRWLRLSSDSTADERYRIRVRITNHHHTADKNGVHLKITTFLGSTP